MDNLNEIILDAQWTSGACAVGVATLETLAGGPPSADLTYVLPDAKSAIVFGFALDQELIGRYLRKEERRAHELDNIHKNMMASGAALFGEKFLERAGLSFLCGLREYRVPQGYTRRLGCHDAGHFAQVPCRGFRDRPLRPFRKRDHPERGGRDHPRRDRDDRRTRTHAPPPRRRQLL